MNNIGATETFYTDFYRLRASPFHITPDPDNILLTEAHKHALAAIYYGVAARKGFIVVTGEVGVGKTSVLRASLDRLPQDRTRIIYLYDPRLTTPALNRSILEELTDAPAPPEAEVLAALQRKLIELHGQGLNVVLAVDEAQNMPEETLENLRVLSNLETRSDKLLQIVLVGQPELDQMLNRRSLRQLRQRIAVRASIPPLSFGQSCRYIDHRLAAAGRSAEDPLFSVSARWYLAFAARGVPRQLNIFADNALVNGYGDAAERIGLSIVREATREFRTGARRGGRRWLTGAALAALAAVALLGGTRGWESMLPQLRPNGSAPAETAIAVAVARDSAAGAGSAEAQRRPASSDAAIAAEAPAAPAGMDAPAPAEPAAVTKQVAAPPIEPVAAPARLAATAPTAAIRPSADPGQSSPQPAAGATAPPASLPHARAAPPPELAAGESVDIVVRPGDSLLKLCQNYYGNCDATVLKRILRANPNIRSADRIASGGLLKFPALHAIADTRMRDGASAEP